MADFAWVPEPRRGRLAESIASWAVPGPVAPAGASAVTRAADPCASIIADFDPISLAEMDSVALLDRTDTKFLFHCRQLPALLSDLAESYRLLEVDGIRLAGYETRYLDTPDHRFFLAHHNGRMPRTKVRLRRYTDSNLTFLEVKIKTRKGRTNKQRMLVTDIAGPLEGEARGFVAQRTDLADDLETSLWNRFDRLTFVHKQTPERLTLDFNLGFGRDGQDVRCTNLAIGELKQVKLSRSTHGYSAFRRLGIRPKGMSKYCLGKVMTHPGLKYNAFKPRRLLIEKIGRQ